MIIILFGKSPPNRRESGFPCLHAFEHQNVEEREENRGEESKQFHDNNILISNSGPFNFHLCLLRSSCGLSVIIEKLSKKCGEICKVLFVRQCLKLETFSLSWVIAYSRLVACINFFSAANLDEGFCCKFFSFLSLCRRFGARQRERGRRLFIRVGYPFLYLFPFLLCSFRSQTRAAAAA